MKKQFFVSSTVQAILLKEVLIPQMKDGFWKDHRPANHHEAWADVDIVVSADERLGADGWKVPRNYNFVNPEFIKPNEQLLVSTAQKARPTSTFRSVKKELIELSWIAGGRLTSKSGTRVKANRGNNKTAPVDSSVLEQARAALHGAVAAVKKTAVKKPAAEQEVEIIKTSSGATVRRVKVSA